MHLSPLETILINSFIIPFKIDKIGRVHKWFSHFQFRTQLIVLVIMFSYDVEVELFKMGYKLDFNVYFPYNIFEFFTHSVL